jgi:hypothetical protein
MIVELIDQGYRVGIAAVSHKVISNLLSESCKVGRQNNVPVLAVQKPDATDGCVDPLVKLVTTIKLSGMHWIPVQPTSSLQEQPGFGHAPRWRIQSMFCSSMKRVKCR